MQLVALSFMGIKGSIQFFIQLSKRTHKNCRRGHLKTDTTADEATQMIALLQTGMRQCNVALRLNLSRFLVRRVYQRFLETVGYVRRHRSGRRRRQHGERRPVHRINVFEKSLLKFCLVATAAPNDTQKNRECIYG